MKWNLFLAGAAVVMALLAMFLATASKSITAAEVAAQLVPLLGVDETATAQQLALLWRDRGGVRKMIIGFPFAAFALIYLARVVAEVYQGRSAVKSVWKKRKTQEWNKILVVVSFFLLGLSASLALTDPVAIPEYLAPELAPLIGADVDALRSALVKILHNDGIEFKMLLYSIPGVIFTLLLATRVIADYHSAQREKRRLDGLGIVCYPRVFVVPKPNARPR
jgi:hypothetical protein